jgi:hypothetical protein
VIRFDPVRRERIVGCGTVAGCRIAAAAMLFALIGVLFARGVLGMEVLVTLSGLVILLILGFSAGAALPSAARGVVTSGRLPAVLWPWTLPMRNVVDGRTVDVLPLLVKDITGHEHRCEIRGRLVPGSPESGEVVEVYGYRRRVGTVRVRQVVTVASGATARARLPFACGLTRTVALAVPAVWTAMTVVLLWLLVFGQ